MNEVCTTPSADTSYARQLVTINAAAEELGVRRFPVYRLTDIGELEYFLIPGQSTRWLRRTDVDALAVQAMGGRDLTAEAKADDEADDLH